MFEEPHSAEALRIYMLETAPVVALTLDAHHCITGANAQALQFLRGECMGRPFAAQIVDFSRTLDLPSLIRQKGAVHPLTLSSASGRPETLSFRFFPLTDGTLALGSLDFPEQQRLRDEVLGLNRELNNLTRQLHQVNAELHELNELKSRFIGMQIRLALARKMEAVGQLACGMGHEINNPLMGIINYAQLIKDRLQGNNEALQEFAGEIVIAAERIAGIVRGLSAFATRDIARCTAVPVADVVESALAATRATLTRDHIALEVDMPGNLPAISCDRGQIEQVLTGLLNNARDALNEKYPGRDDDKRIIIKGFAIADLSAVALAKADCRLPIGGVEKGLHDSESQIADRKSAIRLTVEDHGAGIPDAVREHIFEPFFTTKDKSVGAGSIGKGLGLFVNYATVQEHGGTLTAESLVGQWTRFHVDLPVERVVNTDQ